MTTLPLLSAPQRLPTQSAPLCLRTFGRDGDWLLAMRALAPHLANAYPSGDRWLSRRLDDVEEGRAYARVIECAGELGGITIETPKPGQSIKLSTLWLAPPL